MKILSQTIAPKRLLTAIAATATLVIIQAAAQEQPGSRTGAISMSQILFSR